MNKVAMHLPFLPSLRHGILHSIDLKQGYFRYFLVFVLPGALWLASVTAICTGIFFEKILHKRLLQSLPFMYGISIEVCQYFHCTNGTFDWIDVGVVPLACSAGIFLGNVCFKSNPIDKKWGLILLFLAFFSLFFADVWEM